jgi:hypothetical protein
MEPEHQITFGPFRLKVPQGRLWRGDHRIPLRPRSLWRCCTIWRRIPAAW